MFSGVASTPDWTIRAGNTFKQSVTGPLICALPETNTKTADEVSANARLIALAPEMAEALQDAARCLSEYRSTGSMAGWDKTLSQARAILARVNGGGV